MTFFIRDLETISKMKSSGNQEGAAATRFCQDQCKLADRRCHRARAYVCIVSYFEVRGVVVVQRLSWLQRSSFILFVNALHLCQMGKFKKKL